jgi:DNA-binding transcriptional MerR regulator
VTDVTEDKQGLTIDELARRTGMTVRNIRAHQSRGLLPAPSLRGRTGYYGPEHVARIELVRELQQEGFNLESIKRLIESANGSTQEVLSFTRALRQPFGEEQPRVVGPEELQRPWGPQPALLDRAISLDIVRPLGGGRFELRSPRLLRAGGELAALGIPGDVALDVFVEMRRHADGVADAYVNLFLERVWKPFEQEGHPPERWPEVQDALERLRPVATESLLAVFQLSMSEAIERAFGRELDPRGPEAR